ncbi:DUF3679 domain-containing protein [Kroppenstedtia pulmonis]|uniref:DUF3679 domain-containing protein n=1 Tax=Kroppenstedtia pulmonis TaxID=1380685 RepID=A0A7D3Y5K9_9BACL|nr:DUF3679 domain-containing protein [Kroppenstedtia pulmonis]QKG84965.1 DUF3679 domain-containing protein [Kroppenstedtia pulmonis]
MRMMLQVMALMLVLMFGIFLGIDTAETNIQKVQGSEGAPRAVHITPDSEGRVEIAVLGHVYDVPVIEKKEKEDKDKKKNHAVPQHLDENSSWLAVAGNQAGGGIRRVSREMLEFLISWWGE